jgi:hypothetical protein
MYPTVVRHNWLILRCGGKAAMIGWWQGKLFGRFFQHPSDEWIIPAQMGLSLSSRVILQPFPCP